MAERTRTAAPRPGPQGMSDRQKQAAARARQKSKDRASERTGRNHLSYSGSVLEPKAGQSTLISVLSYKVEERHHPEAIKPGEWWYRRPYKRHGRIGVDEDNLKAYNCPKSFNPKSPCCICSDVAEWRKDWDENKEVIKRFRASDRELYLIYDHDAKEVKLLDQPYGGFGELLDGRIANPRKEEWAAFWLDGNDGMALDVMWTSQKIGTNEWIKAQSIDFVPRSEAPVPAEAWKKAQDLSKFLRQISSEDLQEAYYSGDTQTKEEEEPTTQKQEQEQEEDEVSEEDFPFEEDGQSEEEPEPDLSSMSKEELVAFAKENELFDAKGQRLLARMKDKELREKVIAAWEESQKSGNDDEEETADGECPNDHAFGKDFNEHEDCSKCADEVYQKCMELN